MGSWAVVVLPVEIDMACAPQVVDDLAGVLVGGVSVVVVDMTATVFCDTSGVQILLLAGRQARAMGIELRLVVPSAAVRQVFSLLGVDLVLPMYHNLDEVRADAPAGAGEPG